MNQTCPRTDEIDAYRLGRVDRPRADEIGRHLAACPMCRARPSDLFPETVSVPPAVEPDVAGVGKSFGGLSGLPGGTMRSALAPASPGAETKQASHAPAYQADEPNDGIASLLSPPRAPGELGRLGRFRILKVLGRGGMGVVFQAVDPDLNRQVAIKAMLPFVAAVPTAKQRFLREARAAAGLRHDHVITIHHVGEENGVTFLVMEFLDGESLDDRLKREGTLPVPELLRVGRETAEALAAAHGQGLIHRDIKPGNLWLQAPSGRVKVLDFGLAHAPADGEKLTQTGAVLGTPAYMSPEQGRGHPLDGRSDLFSLGVLLYRAATGKLPFTGTDSISFLVAIASDEPEPAHKLMPTLPPAVSGLIMRLLAKRPDDRPASAAAVADALRTLGRCEPPTVALPAAPTDVRPQPPRQRTPVFIGAAVLAAMVVGGFFLAGRNRPAETMPPTAAPDAAPREPVAAAPSPAVAPPPSPADQEEPFVILRDGRRHAAFKTWLDLAGSLGADDVVEIWANGPLVLPRCTVTKQTISLRAARGYRPRLVPDDEPKSATWLTVYDGSLRIEGCDLEAGDVRAFAVSGGDCRLLRVTLIGGQQSGGDLGFIEGGRLVAEDSYLERGRTNTGVMIGKGGSVEVRNSILYSRSWGGAGTWFGFAAPGGQELRLERATADVTLGTLARIAGPLAEPVRVLADGCLFDTGGALIDLAPPVESVVALRGLVRWDGRDNCYVMPLVPDSLRTSFVKGLAGPVQPKEWTRESWATVWGKAEAGSRFVDLVAYRGDAAWLGNIEAVGADLEAERQRLGNRPANAGPNLAIIGPGDPFVRALAAAGTPVSAGQLRPAPPAGGPVVLLRERAVVAAYPRLQPAIDAARDGDVIELRADRIPIDHIARQPPQPAKRLTVRAAPGYRPVVGSFLLLEDDRWTFEGLFIEGAPCRLYRGLERVANCGFTWPRWPGVSCLDPGPAARTRPVVVENCILPPPAISTEVTPPGLTIQVRNCLVGNVAVRRPATGAVRIELDHCLVGADHAAAGVVALWGEGEGTLDVRGTHSVVDLPLGFRQKTIEAFRWSGDDNILRFRGTGLFWDARAAGRDLSSWRQRWGSDGRSVEAEPTRFVARRWELLPGTPGAGEGPGGHAYGFDPVRFDAARAAPVGTRSR